jgi:hypothetical protein
MVELSSGVTDRHLERKPVILRETKDRARLAQRSFASLRVTGGTSCKPAHREPSLQTSAVLAASTCARKLKAGSSNSIQASDCEHFLAGHQPTQVNARPARTTRYAVPQQCYLTIQANDRIFPFFEHEQMLFLPRQFPLSEQTIPTNL